MLLGIGAIMLLPLGDAQALSDLYPVFAAVLARVWLQEPLQAALPFALVLSIGGSMLISQPAFLFGRSSGAAAPCIPVAMGPFSLCKETLGYATAVLTSLAMAVCYPLVRKATAAHPLQLVAALTLFQALWTVVYVLLSSERFLPPSDLSPHAVCLIGGMVCCVFTYQVAFSRGTQLIPAGLGSVLASTDVVWAYVYQTFAFGQAPGLLNLAGMGCVLLAVTLLGAEKVLRALRSEEAQHSSHLAGAGRGRCETGAPGPALPPASPQGQLKGVALLEGA